MIICSLVAFSKISFSEISFASHKMHPSQCHRFPFLHRVCNHHHDLVFRKVHRPQRNLALMCSHFPFPCPALGNHSSLSFLLFLYHSGDSFLSVSFPFKRISARCPTLAHGPAAISQLIPVSNALDCVGQKPGWDRFEQGCSLAIIGRLQRGWAPRAV